MEEGDAKIEDAVVDDGIARIAGHVKHVQVWMIAPEPIGQDAPGHARHDDVRHQQINARGSVKACDRIFACRRQDDAVAQVLERFPVVLRTFSSSSTSKIVSPGLARGDTGRGVNGAAAVASPR